MLNLDRLRALHAVATHGSVQAAADALHVSPSAVSQQLAKLEREVDASLLDRAGRGVRLTDAAILLSERTSEVLALLEQLESELDERRGAVVGTVRISAFPTAARGLGPAVLTHLREHFPDLEPALIEQEPIDSFPQLARGDLDLVIAQDWYNAPLVLPHGLDREPLFDDTADIALPTGHRLAHRRSIRLDELAAEPWVTWPEGSICGDWLLHTMRTLGHEPRVAHRAAEHATLLALVAAGHGAAVMPRLGLDHVPAGVRLVPVEPAVTRHVFAAWRSDASRRSAIRAARDALVAVTRDRT